MTAQQEQTPMEQLKSLEAFLGKVSNTRNEMGKFVTSFAESEESVTHKQIEEAKEVLEKAREQLGELEKHQKKLGQYREDGVKFYSDKKLFEDMQSYVPQINVLIKKKKVSGQINELNNAIEVLSKLIDEKEQELSASPAVVMKRLGEEIAKSLAFFAEQADENEGNLLVDNLQGLVERQQWFLRLLEQQELELGKLKAQLAVLAKTGAVEDEGSETESEADELAADDDKATKAKVEDKPDDGKLIEEEVEKFDLNKWLIGKESYEGDFLSQVNNLLSKKNLSRSDAEGPSSIYYLAFLEAMVSLNLKEVSELEEIKKAPQTIEENYKTLVKAHPEIAQLNIFSDKNIDKYVSLIKKYYEEEKAKKTEEQEKKKETKKTTEKATSESAPEFVEFDEFSLDALAKKLDEEGKFQTQLSSEDFKVLLMTIAEQTAKGPLNVEMEEPVIEIKDSTCSFKLTMNLSKKKSKARVVLEGEFVSSSTGGIELSDELKITKSGSKMIAILLSTQESSWKRNLSNPEQYLQGVLEKEMFNRRSDLSGLHLQLVGDKLIAAFNQDIDLTSVSSNSPRKKKKVEASAPSAAETAPVGDGEFSYTASRRVFEKSSSIESKDGEFLGEYGMEETKNEEVVSKAGAEVMEIWLFDKNDTKTETVCLLPPSAAQSLRSFYESGVDKATSINQVGQELELKTANLVMKVTVEEVEFSDDKTRITKLKVKTEVSQKTSEDEEEIIEGEVVKETPEELEGVKSDSASSGAQSMEAALEEVSSLL